MSEWKVRIPGRHPIGPLSTELLVRGIRTGRVPLDALVCEMGQAGWQPLGAIDEFFEAMGLADAHTRVLGTPARLATQDAENDSAGASSAVVVESTPEDVPAEPNLRRSGLSSPPTVRLRARSMTQPGIGGEGSAALSARPARSSAGERRRPFAIVRADSCAPTNGLVGAARHCPESSSPALDPSAAASESEDVNPDAGATAITPRRTVSIAAGSPAAASTGGSTPPARARASAPAGSERPRGSTGPASPSPSGIIKVPDASAPQRPSLTPLMDADEEDEESGSLSRKARERFPNIRPLVANVRSKTWAPAAPRAEARLVAGKRTGSRRVSYRIEQADELTAPAVRLQRAYNRTRTALLVIMALLALVVAALVATLLARH